MFEISDGCVSISRRTSTSRGHGTTSCGGIDWIGSSMSIHVIELFVMDGKPWGNTDSTSSQVLLVKIYYCDEQRCMERGKSPSNMFNEEFGTLNFI